MNYGKMLEVTSHLTEKLYSIRKRLQEKLKDVSHLVEPPEASSSLQIEFNYESDFCKKIRQVYSMCTEELVDIAASVIDFSIDALLQKPPCSFAVVALGSLANVKQPRFQIWNTCFWWSEKMMNLSITLSN